jgi:pumilio family protein 6
MAATTTSASKRKGDGSLNNKTKKAKVIQEHKQQSSSQQKRAVKHERQSHRKHADAVATSKEIWNKLRLKNNSLEETHRLTAELMELLRGKVNEVALQHDASRVVQAAIQFSTPEERKEIVMELCQTGSLSELSKVQYAHFVVLKMIKYCSRDEECVRAIVKVSPTVQRVFLCLVNCPDT